jgi:hypothetical protein
MLYLKPQITRIYNVNALQFRGHNFQRRFNTRGYCNKKSKFS